ncbi:MAG: linear amide C-N hydrolase, partial [Candidatus Lokiarchaeota archaeon]|nr:linear amide C-N hydrolase [Candidatus Lokiarchaeota archaeon]
MYHPRFKGEPYEMGQKMGRIFKRANVEFPINLDSFQTNFGKTSGKLLKKYFPEASMEIKGITDTIQFDHDLFTAWMMCMGCCLDLNNEDSVEVRGCTAFSFIHDGKVFYGRNNDLPPFLQDVSKSVYYEPLNKNRFILNTSSFINGEEGINEHGLVAAMTYVLPKLNEIRPGINSVFLVRYILENCTNVDEGIECLKNLPIASSCNILLSDKSSKMVIAECNPLKINLRDPEKNEKDEDFVVTVNHFTSKKMWKHDASNQNLYFSKERYQVSSNNLRSKDYDDGFTFIKSLLRGEYGFMCQYKRKLNFKTIWSSIFDVNNLKTYLAEGDPRWAKYKEDKR